ncbi:MAG: SDR family oxidoreductase [Pirellulaceae bacterium]
MRTIDLTGRVALVTGGGQGIGLAIAKSLHTAGAHVCLNYFPDPDGNNQRIADEAAKGLGERASTFGANVRNREQLNEMMRSISSQFGGLDFLVNNAGILRDKSFRKMSQNDWQDVIDTNLTGVFNVAQTAAEVLKDNGAIVNIASLSAVTGFFGQANYASAKAGVIAFTKVLSKELARKNIRVNAIAPGVVNTEMGQSIPEENRKVMLTNIPLARFAEPNEIGDVAMFLCSDLSSYMTGQTLHVNGGWWA